MFLFFTVLFSLTSFASNLHHEPKWLKLLHYKKTFLGNIVSEADAPTFFLHPEGKHDPKAELEAAMKAFGSTDKPGNDHPICKFPLRYKWLNAQLGNVWKADFSGCQNYIEFFTKLAARRASIVFSSYYLTNPNSAFGHTLLRLSRYDDRGETEMLDYGINYAAKANETNPFLYAVKGLFGGFIGEFAAIPYYYKIREYSDFEFRDLWSFDLKMTPLEVLEMVDHIWELGSTSFDYYYFHENCSYHLLSILEVARPSLELTSKYHLYTIPADTIRLLRQENLIEEGKRRESTYSRLTRLSDDLSTSELELAGELSDMPALAGELTKKLGDKEAARVLDVAIEAFDYKNFEGMLKDDQKTKERKFPLLQARAQNPVITKDTLTTSLKSESPGYSHAPTRLSLAQNYFDQYGTGTRLEYRAALHDLLDPPAGSMKDASIEMGRLSVEVAQTGHSEVRPRLDHFSVLTIRNFQEQNFWASPLSWEIDLGAKSLRRVDCVDCPSGFISGSVGNALKLLNEKILFALLLNTELDVQSQFENNYLLGLGPKAFVRFRFNDHWAASLSTHYHYQTTEHRNLFTDHEWRSEGELRHHLTERISLSLRGGGIERERQTLGYGEFGLQYFYE